MDDSDDIGVISRTQERMANENDHSKQHQEMEAGLS